MRADTITIPKGGDMRDAFLRIQLFVAAGDTEVSIKRKAKRRTVDQNALLWSLYTDAIRQGGEVLAGWEKDDIHELMLIEHFGSREIRLGKRRRLVPLKRSSKLSKMEFADFVEFVVRYFAGHGIVLRLPGDPLQW